MNPAAWGFPYPDDLVYLFVGGSQLHGAKLQGKDDFDFYGVFVEPPEKVLGVDSYEHFVYSTGNERGQNTKDDIDICLYGLRKWARLACKGNPSVLHFLFAQGAGIVQQREAAWGFVQENTKYFLARSHLGSFLGYGNAQLKRLQNQRSKDVNRPYLETLYGYDTKYAMHIVRLMYEAKELMETGWVSLPRPERAHLIDIRQGRFPLYAIIEEADRIQREALAAKEKSPLPEKLDRVKVSQVVAEAYRMHWESR